MLLHLFYAPPYNINTQIIKSFMCMYGAQNEAYKFR